MKAKRELVKRPRHEDAGSILLKVDYGNTSESDKQSSKSSTEETERRNEADNGLHIFEDQALAYPAIVHGTSVISIRTHLVFTNLKVVSQLLKMMSSNHQEKLPN